MSRGLAMIAVLLAYAPSPPPEDSSSFQDPMCEDMDGPAKRQRCYFDTIARHPHLWKQRPRDAILQWHVDKAEHIFNDGILREGLDGQSLKYTDASENMFRTSMILVTDVRDEDATPRNAEICRFARKALDHACKVTHCAYDQDTPAGSASVGDSAAMAKRMYDTACPDDWSGCPPSPSFSTPTYCKGVELVRLAVAQRLERLNHEEHETRKLAALVPGAEVGADESLQAWKQEAVTLALELEDEIATGKFDAAGYAKRVGEYQATIELPRVIAAKEERLEVLSRSLGKDVPNEKLRAAPKPKALCKAGAPSCAKLGVAIERFYDQLDRQDEKTLLAWEHAKGPKTSDRGDSARPPRLRQ